MGGAGGVYAKSGEGPPDLEVGEAVFDGSASGGKNPGGVLFAGGELAIAGCLEAGDDHGVAYVVVQAAKAKVRQRPETGGAQLGQDVVVAGSGDVVGAVGPGGGSPDQAASLVCQSEEVQAVTVAFGGVVTPVGLYVRRWVWMRVPSIRTTSPPRLATFFRARSRRGACAASRVISSSRQRRTVDSETLLPPAMSAGRWS